MRSILFLFIVFCFACSPSQVSDTSRLKQVVYKNINKISLTLDVYYPPGFDSQSSFPSIVFFHGGHWVGGVPKMMRPTAQKFARKGFVTFTAQYRLERDHDATPFEALMDAKSAIRYLRENAKSLKLNPNQILAAGGSAGGHLAAATACTKKYNESTDNLNIDCVPDGIILYNSVIDNGPEGYGYNRIKEEYHDFSPFHLVRENLPPTLILHGEDDELISSDRMIEYCRSLNDKQNACTIKCYKGVGHKFNVNIYNASIPMAIKFFTEHKIIDLETSKQKDEH